MNFSKHYIKRREKNGYKIIRGETKRKCKKCGKDFYPYSDNHIYCGSKKSRKGCSYLKAKEKSKKIQKKIRKKNGLGKWKFRFNLLKRDNFTCQYCGRKAPEVILQIDHIYPKSKGGLGRKENYITACVECNVGKGDSLLK